MFVSRIVGRSKTSLLKSIDTGIQLFVGESSQDLFVGKDFLTDRTIDVLRRFSPYTNRIFSLCMGDIECLLQSKLHTYGILRI